MLREFALVAAGGAIGAMLRYGTSMWLARGDFPWATLLVNLVGSLALGLLAGTSDGPRLFLVVGVLGAFTTLSTYSLETMQLVQAGRHGAAAVNAAANALGGPLLAALGWWVQRS